MAVISEILGENLQTWEEFRLGVERHMYGISLENVNAGSIPVTPLEKVVFEPPQPPEERVALSRFSSLTNVLDRR